MDALVLPPKDRAAKIAELSRFLANAFAGKPVRVKVEVAREDRTPAQNRYLWSVPYRMLKEVTGFTEDDLHEWFCGQHFGWKETTGPKTPRNPDGLYSEPVRTTTTDENGKRDLCSGEDMNKIWELAQRVGAEKFGIFIPDPDPDYKRKRTQSADARPAR
jgi:hypothetical protein